MKQQASAFSTVYTKIEQITKATCSLRANDVMNEEMALIDGRPAQVVKIQGDLVTLQVFSGTQGIANNVDVIFLKEPPNLKVGTDLSGRFFNAYGQPLDGGPELDGVKTSIG
ncbi:MAG: V-type ATP synthase subunit B, partial [Candidatus Heimdallarchaeota archaeon]|nr:V-type ATP synthase subunit B [Candidatus Heimdallarchaeota archaeon]